MVNVHINFEDISDPRFRHVCQQIIERMESLQVPGVSIGILCDGVTYSAGLGVTNVDHPQPVTSRTLFEIGSTGKTYTALAAMCLVEQDKLDLDTPIRTYLPDLKLSEAAVVEKVTMRHLLTHTPGWLGDHFIDCGSGDDALTRYTATLETVPQMTPLGEVFSYCNSGFILAGRVIEALTGKVYDAAMQELVFDPLGLKNSFYLAQNMMNRPFASGHHNEPGTNKPVVADPWPVPRWAAPAGGVIADIPDQLTYAAFLMGDGTAADGTRVLKTETLEQMRSPQAVAGGGLGDWVGLSLMLQDLYGERVIFHGGSINGQQSDFRFVPARKFAMALDTNADNGILLHIQMAPIILETFLGYKAPQIAPLVLPDADLAQYTGVFQKPDGSGFRITPGEKGRLAVTTLDGENPETYAVEFYAPDKVRMIDLVPGMRCDFLRGPDNQVEWYRESGRILKRQP